MSAFSAALRASEQYAEASRAASLNASHAHQVWEAAERAAEFAHRLSMEAHRHFMAAPVPDPSRCAWCVGTFPGPRYSSNTCSLACHEQEIDA